MPEDDFLKKYNFIIIDPDGTIRPVAILKQEGVEYLPNTIFMPEKYQIDIGHGNLRTIYLQRLYQKTPEAIRHFMIYSYLVQVIPDLCGGDNSITINEFYAERICETGRILIWPPADVNLKSAIIFSFPTNPTQQQQISFEGLSSFFLESEQLYCEIICGDTEIVEIEGQTKEEMLTRMNLFLKYFSNRKIDISNITKERLEYILNSPFYNTVMSNTTKHM